MYEGRRARGGGLNFMYGRELASAAASGGRRGQRQQHGEPLCPGVRPSRGESPGARYRREDHHGRRDLAMNLCLELMLAWK